MSLLAAFARQKEGKQCAVCTQRIPFDRYQRHLETCRVASDDDECQVVQTSIGTATVESSRRRRSSDTLTRVRSAEIKHESVDEEEEESSEKLNECDVPYYARFFEQIINTVCTGRSDFWKAHFTVIEQFQQLNDSAKQLFIRLFLRKRKWLSLARLKYDCISLDLRALFDQLVENGLVESGDRHLTDLEEVLALLQLPALKKLAKVYRIDAALSARLLRKNLLQTAVQKSVFGASLHDVILKRAKLELGASYRIDLQARRVFMGVFASFAPADMSSAHLLDRPSINLAQQLLFTLLEVDRGNVRFPAPSTSHNHRNICASLEDLMKYVDAMDLEHAIALNVAAGRYDKVEEIAADARKQLVAFRSGDSLARNAKIQHHLRRFTEPWVLTRCVWHGVDALQRLKRHSDAVDSLRFLLYGDPDGVFCADTRGAYWDRLALNLHAHLRRKDDAIAAIRDGFNDVFVKDRDRLLLQDRLLRLCKGTAVDMVVQISEPVKKEITGQLLHKNLGDERVNRFVTSGQGFAACSVEQVALEHYLTNEGFLEGVHGEGAPWHTLFGLLCYAEIFAHDVEDAWLSPLQTEPADLNSASAFYPKRKAAFDARLQWLSDATALQMTDCIDRVWSERAEETNALLHFDTFEDVEQVKRLCLACGGRLLSALFARMTKDFRNTRSGFPDLTVWRADKVAVIEVKGPGDRLSTKQRLWLDFFHRHDVDAHVCHVIGNKKRRID